MEYNDYLNSKYSLLFFIIIAFIYNIIVHQSKIVVLSMFIILFYLFNLYDIQNKIKNKDFKNKKNLIIE